MNGFEPRLLANGTLAAVESKTLEYKRDLSSSTRILKTLVAFANSAGGALVMGVDDKRFVVGVADPILEENRLTNLVLNGIFPHLLPEIEIMTVAGKSLLIARVYPSTRRPHFVREEGPERGVFMRLGSSTLQADEYQREELQRSARGIAFDELPNETARHAGLDEIAIRKTFPNRVLPQAKEVLRLVTSEQGRVLPTNGGVLLFGKNREQCFPDAWIQCGRFRGKDLLHLDDQQELHDHLLNLPEAVEAFLKKHAFRAADIRGMKRHDVWSIPLDILREVVLNALVHSDYSQRGGPIRVAFFDDRIEVESLGGLLSGMTPEMMRAGISRIRNPVIARVFRETGYIEQWGMGVRGIFARAARQGLPEPQIIEFPGRLRFVIHTRHLEFLEQHGTKEHQVVHQVEHQVEHQVSQQLLPLFEALSVQERSRTELLALLDVSSTSRNVQRHLYPLMEAGWLEMTQPEHPRSPTQKYRLTAAGREVLEKTLSTRHPEDSKA
ncbi:MAG: putative DNA binding domain-containing protein [Zoogloeaceae bacterium]|jgi:predicted HTH transcriptional regulator|nr:putative DNA binding domain-containing protein [Zoogloeaceae bacterium]